MFLSAFFSQVCSMCVIVGVINHNLEQDSLTEFMKIGLERLAKRGPDFQNYYQNDKIAFGHARLSIIDTSAAANQPFWDESKRYCLVFNGEIFNFQSLKKDLQSQGYHFNTNSDTEVLLRLLILKGKKALNELNGFFAFAFYDLQTGCALLARDRYGIKPLVYSIKNNSLVFASEIKALLPFLKSKEIDKQSLQYFFKFNYIPTPNTILKGVAKLNAGECLEFDNEEWCISKYYQIQKSKSPFIGNYDDAKKAVYELLEDATKLRMISDVPLGSFLSGGIDSSIVSTIAAKHTSNLNTFSIGFKDEPYYDETEYANLVAKNIKSNHTVFSLSNDDLLEHYQEALDYFDEPFADSSALNMFILSKKTKSKVTVALSGDGADELFSGYNKHEALWLADQGGLKNSIVKNFGVFGSRMLPKSRDSKIGNLGRKLEKFSSGLQTTSQQRYLDWASFMGTSETEKLTNQVFELNGDLSYLLDEVKDFNDYLLRDFKLVLQGDMLRKVDAMSMANSLEVRTPFLDYRLVDLVFSMPSEFKIQKGDRKRLLKDAFRKDLPEEIFNRGKKGFEVPLRKWFNKELKTVLEKEVFNKGLIVSQGFLNWEEVENIQKKLYSNNPNDAVYNTWTLLGFQRWIAKYYNN